MPDYWPSGSANAQAIFNQITALSIIHIEDLAAGDDIAARAEWAAPAAGATLTRISIVPKGSSAGIDNSNTSVITVADGDGNTIVAKTYNTATQPPAANVLGAMGALSSTHKVMTGNEVLTVAVLNGATADLPGFFLEVEYIPVITAG